MRLYTRLCQSVCPSVCPSHFTFFRFLRSFASLLLPKWCSDLKYGSNDALFLFQIKRPKVTKKNVLYQSDMAFRLVITVLWQMSSVNFELEWHLICRLLTGKTSFRSSNDLSQFPRVFLQFRFFFIPQVAHVRRELSVNVRAKRHARRGAGVNTWWRESGVSAMSMRLTWLKLGASTALWVMNNSLVLSWKKKSFTEQHKCIYKSFNICTDSFKVDDGLYLSRKQF